MSKVITFSTVFPKHHRRSGEPTYFVEKILNGLYKSYEDFQEEKQISLNFRAAISPPKIHTIRAGNRFKVGDKFSPRIWSGKPYQSKQITICEDLEVVAEYKIEIKNRMVNLGNDKFFLGCPPAVEIAKNDGLLLFDFYDWFADADFSGQIICWIDPQYSG